MTQKTVIYTDVSALEAVVVNHPNSDNSYLRLEFLAFNFVILGLSKETAERLAEAITSSFRPLANPPSLLSED